MGEIYLKLPKHKKVRRLLKYLNNKRTRKDEPNESQSMERNT